MTLAEGTILEWKKDVGEFVGLGEELCEVETEKVTEYVESPVEGTLLKLLIEEGETIPVLTVICLIGDPDEVV